MELREFAEQVLFATSLELKLQAPAVITDHNPGSLMVAPAAPGRPAELRFKPQGSPKADFPSLHRLENAMERGRLLHFFANHELLATELMALVLLRFPEAPASFRRGLLQTLKDEQRHTALYLRRMQECGVQFGDLPVSGYFWRAVSTMQNPIDYVASLCLTFEQANLDFCRHFARGFEAVGDKATALLLEGIYRDEIGHVAYGLKWFRRWKKPGESDWDAFCRHLKFPLSPNRAKGFAFNTEGRRAAGFDASFIAELKVYSQSKGRTPNVFVFNPFTEGYIAQGKSFTPVKHQQLLARDLENLPQYLCRQDDIVLVSKRPSVEFLSAIRQAGFPLPEFVEISNQPPWLKNSPTSYPHTAAWGNSPLSKLAQRKLGTLRPWAWGPDSRALFEPLLAQVTGENRATDQRFSKHIAQLYSKAWSAGLLRKFLNSSSQGDEGLSNAECSQSPLTSATTPSWLCTEAEVGVAATTLDDALKAIAAMRKRGHHRVIVKEAVGLAGHNAIRLWEPDLLESQRRWIGRALQHGQEVVIEPWLERELDFSVQLEMELSGLRLCAYTGLMNDRKGQFLANWAEVGHLRRLPTGITSRLKGPNDISARLHRLYERLFLFLEAEIRPSGYLGPVSIDAFIYRTPEDNRRLKPIVEINPRYTMGRLTVELMKHTCPGSHGLFRLYNLASIRAQGFDDFFSFARVLSERQPLRLEGAPIPKIYDGALCLNDPAQAQACLGVFRVQRSLKSFGEEGLPF
jgi:uncharacterized ferritin-like protein (DUF455 family)